MILATFALLTGYHDFALELLKGAVHDIAQLREAIMTQADCSADISRKAAKQLAASVEARPADANILVGKFVDERRSRNDFFDVPLDEGSVSASRDGD